MTISCREKKTNGEVLKMADEQLYIIPTTYLCHTIRRNNIHRLILEGPLEGNIMQRKTKNGVDDKYHRMDVSEI